ncbi:DUF4845 domain-containing protein [Thiocapsa rosea]|uniref:Uncharacterized protein DUF4845 n=1 Tax=Thiocapsa rosea TaxID=69360 RepID=A0A495VFK1_9GAMM|nr:DUF4845 domain-containing protein [Thiocapsa rosea]RKT47225.1 uncharacterized protein DUF4845 [Thiocapsa rosea]
MLSILVILSLVIFFVTLLFKLGPAYMGFWTIKSVMDNVAEQSTPISGGAREIANQIGKRLDINNVDQVSAKDFKIRRTGENLYEVTLDYEQRQHVFFNIDTVLTFAYQVEVKGQ